MGLMLKNMLIKKIYKYKHSNHSLLHVTCIQAIIGASPIRSFLLVLFQMNFVKKLKLITWNSLK